MKQTIEVKTDDLEGQALDYAVAIALGWELWDYESLGFELWMTGDAKNPGVVGFTPSTDWAQAVHWSTDTRSALSPCLQVVRLKAAPAQEYGLQSCATLIPTTGT
jgi:hypothetical protein